MESLEPEVRAEYQRAIASLDGTDRQYGSEYLSTADVLRAHFLIANHFYLEGEGLGGIGPRDVNLLHSAVSRQTVSFGGRVKWTDRFDICATLFFGIIKNHPFYDANKRTAFLSVLYLLHRYGWCPDVPQREFEDFTVEIADGLLEKYDRFKKLRKNGDPDPEVKYISWYLRNKTRRIDNRNYSITYRELKAILNRYEFSLSNPRGNYIDIVRLEKRRRLFGLGPEEIVERRIAQIGFPRWTAEVGKAAVKTVREATGLTHDRGIDSAVFFQGLDPMQTLIATYHEPLMRLAHR
ncbi:MAG: type II toxin-antitoxin system death-on-curing family toxin [Phreatobacter sp.]|nr:type II toxin-antitoxin system death-on-curing family toxin [Phreatobacter sp.]